MGRHPSLRFRGRGRLKLLKGGMIDDKKRR
jgi:hypothetical protein